MADNLIDKIKESAVGASSLTAVAEITGKRCLFSVVSADSIFTENGENIRGNLRQYHTIINFGGEIMKNIGMPAMSVGFIINFALFLTKLYIGISSNSLSIYCDSINNLGDTFSCIIAFIGFVLVKKFDSRKSDRTQSLFTFVISLVIAVTGGYFIYNGLERFLYPLPISYSIKYAVVLAVTIVVKLLMGIMYILFNRKAQSPVIKAMVMDSFLDCFITISALMGLVLITRVNYAVDGVFAVITGTFITFSAVKNIVSQAKYLINE